MGSRFLGIIAKMRATKEKNKLNFIKIKHFCAPKDIVKKAKRHPTELEKVFANHISKSLVSRTCKEHLQLKKDVPI